MAGTKEGGLKAAKRMLDKDPDYYKKMGMKGGQKGHSGGFASNPELARIAGKKGGESSSRKGPKYNMEQYLDDIVERFTVKGQSIRYIARRYNVADNVIKRFLSDKGLLGKEYTPVKNFYKKIS